MNYIQHKYVFFFVNIGFDSKTLLSLRCQELYVKPVLTTMLLEELHKDCIHAP